MYKYKVSENKILTPSVRMITLITCDPTGKPFLYQPGQYAAISLHDQLRPTATRCFSLVSSPTQGDVLQFSIRIKGKYTSALERLKEGDVVTVRGPFGSFVFNEHTHKNVVLFAGGIGIAPFISMIRYANDIRAENNIHLVYSCRSENDIPFLNELIKHENHNPNLLVSYVVSDGSTESLRDLRVLTGTLNESTMDKLGLAYEKKTYMVCGPPPYMTAVQNLLTERGVNRNNILSEAFSQSSSKQSSKLVYWPVNAYALTGLLFVIAAGLVVGVDLNKTLPKLQVQDFAIEDPMREDSFVAGDSIVNANLSSIEPQVDTDFTQEPIIKYIINEIIEEEEESATPVPTTVVTPKPVVVQKPTPVVVQKPAPAPAPKPKPTPVVVPKTPPRSTVS